MRARALVRLMLVLSVFAGVSAGAAEPPSPVRKLRVKSVTLRIRHRALPGFREEDSVRLKQDFQVGDTPYTAQVTEFVPDFTMNLKTRVVSSRSNQPNNPAFRIVVRKQGVPQDTSWAFLNMPPHFGRRSLLAFQIARVDFEDRAAIVSGDSTASGGSAP
jgi:hypothetical protein